MRKVPWTNRPQPILKHHIKPNTADVPPCQQYHNHIHNWHKTLLDDVPICQGHSMTLNQITINILWTTDHTSLCSSTALCSHVYNEGYKTYSKV